MNIGAAAIAVGGVQHTDAGVGDGGPLAGGRSVRDALVVGQVCGASASARHVAVVAREVRARTDRLQRSGRVGLRERRHCWCWWQRVAVVGRRYGHTHTQYALLVFI